MIRSFHEASGIALSRYAGPLQLFLLIFIFGLIFCLPGALTFIKHHGIFQGLFSLLLMTMFSILGPLAATIFGATGVGFINIGYDFFAVVIITLLVLVYRYIKSRHKKTLVQLVGGAWVAIGAYYSTLGAMMGV